MLCPSCKAENDDSTENCFQCGKGLFALTQGSVLAARYEILSQLGKGGMGMVYKAHDRVLDEIVAVKVLRGDVAREAEMARRFRSEIKLARRVRHKNVCGIHEYGEEAHLRFIVMEYIEGVDFKRILRERGGFPPEEAIDVAVQVAEGLQAIHDVGIVHRDLKTPNLMRDSKGLVRLMDFGIAKRFESEGTTGATATGHIVGTPEYMSPEQARGLKLDPRSDIYALGVVFFELFTGDVPFRGETPVATILKQIQEPAPLEGPRASRLPPPLRPVLAKALSKDPEDRFASAREMADALRHAWAGAYPDSASTPMPIRTMTAPQPDYEPETTPLPTPVPTPIPTPVPTAIPSVMMPPRAAPRPGGVVAVPAFHAEAVEARATVAESPARPRGSRPAARSIPPRALGQRRAMAWLLILPGLVVFAGVFLALAYFFAPGPSATAPSSRPAATPAAELAPPQGLAAASTEPPASATSGASAALPSLIRSPTPQSAMTAWTAAAREVPASRNPPARETPAPASLPTLPLRPAVTPSQTAAATAPSDSPSPSPGHSALPDVRPSEVAAAPAVPTPSPAAPGQAAGRSPKAGDAGPSSQELNGRLRIAVRPWAEVTVDGKDVGTTPLVLTLGAGPHVVRLTHPDYQPFVRKVTIRADETAKIELDLRLDGIRK